MVARPDRREAATARLLRSMCGHSADGLVAAVQAMSMTRSGILSGVTVHGGAEDERGLLASGCVKNPDAVASV